MDRCVGKAQARDRKNPQQLCFRPSLLLLRFFLQESTQDTTSPRAPSAPVDKPDVETGTMSGLEAIRQGWGENLAGRRGVEGQEPSCEACLSMRQHNSNDRSLKLEEISSSSRLGKEVKGACHLWGESLQTGAGGEGGSDGRRRKRRRSSGTALAGVLVLALVACCPTSAYG